MELGSVELFNALIEETGPVFTVTSTTAPLCPAADTSTARQGAGCGCSEPGARWAGPAAEADTSFRAPSVLLQDTLGPYDYVVLQADDARGLTDWLVQNRWTPPAVPDQVLAQYLGPGRHFLAVRLQPEARAGDLRPVVVRYASDLPMIPLSLTAASTVPALPVTVWVVGPGRAIPRNFYHVVPNDAALDWTGRGGNYRPLVAAAVREAPRGQAFLSEYAGPASAVAGRLPAGQAARFAPGMRLTRLFTVIGAESMTSDPVFGFNPELPDVPSRATAEMLPGCPPYFEGTLVTPQGRWIPAPAGIAARPSMPASLRVEVLRESGPAELVVDHRAEIAAALAASRTPGALPIPDAGAAGDGIISRGPGASAPLLAFIAVPALLAARRRGRRKRG